LRTRLLFLLALGISLSLISAPVAAHHGGAAYDTDKRVTVKGTVTDWLWSNPHCILQLDATDESGQAAHWVAETENPSSMIRAGWTKDSVKVGDVITVLMVPPKTGGHVGRIVEVTLSDGHKLEGRGFTTAGPAKAELPPKP
jgi:hypothetical protein